MQVLGDLCRHRKSCVHGIGLEKYPEHVQKLGGHRIAFIGHRTGIQTSYMLPANFDTWRTCQSDHLHTFKVVTFASASATKSNTCHTRLKENHGKPKIWQTMVNTPNLRKIDSKIVPTHLFQGPVFGPCSCSQGTTRWVRCCGRYGEYSSRRRFSPASEERKVFHTTCDSKMFKGQLVQSPEVLVNFDLGESTIRAGW